MKLQGAIFDLDGTLLDSMPLWEGLAADYLRSLDIEPREGLFDSIKRMTLNEAADYLVKDYSLTLAAADIARAISVRLETFYRHETKLKPGAKDFIDFLRSQQVKLCIVTATDDYLAQAALASHSLLDAFDFVLSCSAFGQGKDKPAIFEHALAKLGTQKQYTPVFEDASHAVRTAKAAGFPVVAVYDASFLEAHDEIKQCADIFVHTLTEARDYCV
jgi:HAD superfamily hydrolase (TIGR01509 family)